MIDFAREREEAIKWAFDLMHSGPFVVLDTETTNTLQNGGEVVQLSAVGSNGETLINQLIRPKGKMSPGAESVHHISMDRLQNKPAWNELYPTVLSMFEGKKIIAYNVGFDKPIIEQTCKLYNLPMFNAEWDCAMLQFARYHGEWNDYRQSFRWKKLVEACDIMKLDVKNAHDALGDVLMTLEVIKAMANLYVEFI